MPDQLRAYQLKPVAAVTVLPVEYAVVNTGYSGVRLDIESTLRTGGTGITVTIDRWDQGKQDYENTYLATASITTADTNTSLTISPHIATAANAALNAVAPKRFRVRVTADGAVTSATFGLGLTFFNG